MLRNNMKPDEQIDLEIARTERLIEEAKWLKRHGATPADREKACQKIKTLKAEKRQLEKLIKRFSPNQLMALDALEGLRY